MSETLYEIATQYREILAMDCDDEDEKAAMVNALDEIIDRFEQKAENVIKYIKNTEAWGAAIRAEEVRLAERRRTMERKAEQLTAYLEAMMTMTGKREVQAGIFQAKFKKNTQSIVVTDESLLDDRFFKISRTVSKDAIKEALKAGEEVPGVILEQKERLAIK